MQIHDSYMIKDYLRQGFWRAIEKHRSPAREPGGIEGGAVRINWRTTDGCWSNLPDWTTVLGGTEHECGFSTLTRWG